MASACWYCPALASAAATRARARPCGPGSVIEVAGQHQCAGQVRLILGGDAVQRGAGLGYGGHVPAGQAEHAVMPGRIAGALDHPGQFVKILQQPEVAGEQVLGRLGRPTAGPVASGPGVQPLAISGEAATEVIRGRDLEFLVSQQVYIRAVPGVGAAGAAAERPPGDGAQDVLGLPQGDTGQLGQVPGGQAATGGGQQPEQVLLRSAAVQQPPQLPIAGSLLSRTGTVPAVSPHK